MDLEIQFVDGCPGWRPTFDRLGVALAEVGLADQAVRLRVVRSLADAEALGFRGSPSIVADGLDLLGDRSSPVAMACRVYPGESGPAGAPSTDTLVAALRQRLSSS